MIYFGVDPGTSGGCGVLFDDRPPAVFPLQTFPTYLKAKNKSGKQKIRNNLDVSRLVSDLTRVTGVRPEFWPLKLKGCIESLQHGGKFADTTGQLMKNYGRLLSVFELYGVEVIQPIPRVWQSWAKSRMSAEAQARVILNQTKTISIGFVQERFPGVDLTLGNPRRKPHDGCADALVMACYAKDANEKLRS